MYLYCQAVWITAASLKSSSIDLECYVSILKAHAAVCQGGAITA